MLAHPPRLGFLSAVPSFMVWQQCKTCVTAGFLSRAGAETPLNFGEKFRVFPRTILENFSGVDTQTAVLSSGIHR